VQELEARFGFRAESDKHDPTKPLTLLHKLNVAPAYFRKYTYTAITTRIAIRI